MALYRFGVEARAVVQTLSTTISGNQRKCLLQTPSFHFPVCGYVRGHVAVILRRCCGSFQGLFWQTQLAAALSSFAFRLVFVIQLILTALLKQLHRFDYCI